MISLDKQATSIVCELKHVLSKRLLNQITDDAYRLRKQQLLEDLQAVNQLRNREPGDCFGR